MLDKIVWLIFRCPGAVILWFRYYFPGKGNVLVSGRQRGVPIIEVMFSLGFWFVFVALIVSPKENSSPVVVNKPPLEKTSVDGQPAIARPQQPQADPQSQTTRQQGGNSPAVAPPAQAASVQKLSPQMAAELVRIVSDQVYACWDLPPSARNAPAIRVEFSLNTDGSLASQPRLIDPPKASLATLADSTLKAVLRCSPLRIPPRFSPFYDDWRTVRVNFTTQ